MFGNRFSSSITCSRWRHEPKPGRLDQSRSCRFLKVATHPIAFFGIDSSPSFVREPEGNGVAERFIRTLKENLLWVRSFETIEDLRLALLAFKRTYNEQWMLEKYAYRSPAQVRRDLVGLDAAA